MFQIELRERQKIVCAKSNKLFNIEFDTYLHTRLGLLWSYWRKCTKILILLWQRAFPCLLQVQFIVLIYYFTIFVIFLFWSVHLLLYGLYFNAIIKMSQQNWFFISVFTTFWQVFMLISVHSRWFLFHYWLVLCNFSEIAELYDFLLFFTARFMQILRISPKVNFIKTKWRRLLRWGIYIGNWFLKLAVGSFQPS